LFKQWKKGNGKHENNRSKTLCNWPFCKLLGSGGKFYGENFRAWN
jgi:hypothetical protein